MDPEIKDVLEEVTEDVAESIDTNETVADIAEHLPEATVDKAEDMIEDTTGMDMDLNNNEADAE